MPRNVPFQLDQIQLSDKRSPAYKVEVFDLKAGYDTIGDVVVGNSLNALTGPRDFTLDVERVGITEEAGNFVDNGIATTSVSLTLTDPHNVFDPWNTVADPTGDGRWLRRGNCVRIWEGDTRIDEEFWMNTFTGLIVGQAGVSFSRAVGQHGEANITVKAVGREVGFLKYQFSSDVFGIGFSYEEIADDIAQGDMGLDSDEIIWSTWGTQHSAHEVNQIVDEYPLVAIAQLMFPDGMMPYFDGEGKLTQSVGTITRQPDRIYTDNKIFQGILKPYSALDPVNRVVVLGLDANLSPVIQPFQLIAETDVTTGYFTKNENILVNWGEDVTQLVLNPKEDVVLSVNGGINKLGNEEDFFFIEAPTGEGTTGVILEISTGFFGALLIYIAIEYLILSFVPDIVVAWGGGFTIPIGRIVQAILMILIMFIMTRVGRGKYAFYGEPFEYVFKELRGIAQIEGTLSADVNEVEIENHFIQTQAGCDSAARDVLFRQQVRGNPRIVSMLHDLRLIPDDIFQTADDDRQYLIGAISRSLVRNPTSGVAAELTAYEVTPGLPV